MKRIFNWSASALSRPFAVALPGEIAQKFRFDARVRPAHRSRPASSPPGLPRLRLVVLLGAALAGGVIAWEMHTSALQARGFSEYARNLTWKVEKGSCASPLQAPSGPYDARLGYAKLPELRTKLAQRGFVVTRQACPSQQLATLVSRGIAPPYAEKAAVTLRILDRRGNDLYEAPQDRFHFASYEEIPEPLVRSLLFVENRQLLGDDKPYMNPALEWDRLAFAGAHYALDKVTRSGNVVGGSTLATQIEKFRHSPEGRTSHPSDKLRQIISASLRAYRTGTDTRLARKGIIVDYMNSMPLGAVPGEGEVTGLGHGMWAWFVKPPERLTVDLSLPEEGKGLVRKAETYKQALALIMATRRPTLYLQQNHEELENRLESYLGLLTEQGIISDRLAQAVRKAPLRFRKEAPKREAVQFTDHKATNAIRTELLDVLDAENMYALDRYDLRAETSLDSPMQEAVTATFKKLSNPAYLHENGFYGEHLLGGADPSRIVYSFSLFESTPQGNRMRVLADNLNKPLDINRDVKLELGSTAKLRTMANYLTIVSDLWQRHREAGDEALRGAQAVAHDPITRWVLDYLLENRGATHDQILDASLERRFSADPHETFFTGGGIQRFANFDDKFDDSVISLRTAFQNSVNLVYIRLMREIVQFYEAEAGYDARTLLDDQKAAGRKPLLQQAMDHEAREALWAFYKRYQDTTYDQALRKLCGDDLRGLRRFTIFYLGEHPDASLAQVSAEGRRLFPEVAGKVASSTGPYFRAYAAKDFSPEDEAWLLNRHPLEVWMVRDKRAHPDTKWSDVVARSTEARRRAGDWINHARFRHAQNVRLRIQLERLAFVEIHKAWQSLGYPFDQLVPSLATAIGSSADKPYALAELVGIIQNHGMRTPFRRVEALYFAEGTPYETHFVPEEGPGKRVMPRVVAASLKELMHEVVEQGTGVRVKDTLHDSRGGVIAIGGKTGSGDNRYEQFASDGSVTSSRAINRTASFVFIIGDHFFGMVSAYVPGAEAKNYSFTSSLALQTFKILGPSIEKIVAPEETQHARAGTASAGDTGVVSSEAAAATTSGSRAVRSAAAPAAIAAR